MSYDGAKGGCSQTAAGLPSLSPTPSNPHLLYLTLKSEIHDAGVQGIHLRVHVSADVEEVPRRPTHDRLRERPWAEIGQGMKRWGLGWCWGVWGQVCLGLDLVVQGD